MKTTAIPRWKAGLIKRGQRYKHEVNGKTYIVEAKTTISLSSFNAIYFINLYPKKYLFNTTSAYTGSSIDLMPLDEVYIEGKRIKNNNYGIMTKAMIDVARSAIQQRQNSYLLINGEEDRNYNIKVRPFINSIEELKFFQPDDQTGYAYVKIEKLVVPVEVTFQVIQTFTPIRAASKTTHTVTINHAGLTVNISGDSPITNTASTKTYSIPNSLTTKKLTLTPNGGSIDLNFV